MSDKFRELIGRLTVEERLELAEALWDSIGETDDAAAVPEWHKEELDRRIKACEDDPSAGSSWEDVKARLGMKS